MTVRKTMRLAGLAGLVAIILVFPLLSNYPHIPTVEAAEPSVTRSPISPTVAAGDNLTIKITPAGLGGFYATKEVLGDLVLVSNTADNLADGVFIQLQATAFEYVVKVPDSAQSCDRFEITGEKGVIVSPAFLVKRS